MFSRYRKLESRVADLEALNRDLHREVYTLQSRTIIKNGNMPITNPFGL